MKNYVHILMLTLLSFNINAQTPQGFNYQATVRNSEEALIANANVYFKFNVLQGSLSSVPVFTEIHYIATDDLGQVNLIIGGHRDREYLFSNRLVARELLSRSRDQHRTELCGDEHHTTTKRPIRFVCCNQRKCHSQYNFRICIISK
jgi:hypothetical protein